MRVTRDVLDTIAAHARRDGPQECCGLLIGDGTRIVEAVPARNSAPDPLRRYEIAPAEYLAQIRVCRERAGAVVMGAYHSHPRSQPVPSPTDAQEAFAGFLYLIAGPVTPEADLVIRAFELADGNLREVTLVPDPEEVH